MKKKYTKEFKEMAVELSYNGSKPLTTLCKDLNIGNTSIYKWREEMSEVKKEVSLETKEMKELRKRLEKLEVENQILKKALAICNKM
jgi:transposase